MKKLLTLLVAVIVAVGLFTAPMIADPGDDLSTDGSSSTDSTATWTDPSYPPPPPGYVGPWPPPDQATTSDDGDGGDEGGWADPGH